MNTSSNWKSLGIVTCSGLALCAGALFSGCNKKSEEAAPLSSSEAPASPATASPAPEAASPVAEAPKEQVPATAIGDPNDPLLHLSMNDTGTDATVTDSSPYAQHQTLLDESGTANTKAHSVPGVIETALTFDGVDDAIEIPAEQVSSAFAADQDFTVSFWWKSDKAPFPDGYRAVLSNCTEENGGIILYQRGDEEGVGRRVYMNFYLPKIGAPVLSPVVSVPSDPGTWHHYVFQRSGQQLRAWCDGILQDESSDSTYTATMGGGNSLRLNSRTNGASGSMDELQVMPRAISEADITTLAHTRPGLETVYTLASRIQILKADPENHTEAIAAATSALDEKLATLEGFPVPLSGAFELVAFDYVLVESGTYDILLALRATSPADKDYTAYVHGVVDKSHADKLPERNGKSTRVIKWGITPDTPTTTWTPGDVMVVQRRVEAPDVPFEMMVNLLHKDPDTGWEPLVPKFITLGWHAAL